MRKDPKDIRTQIEQVERELELTERHRDRRSPGSIRDSYDLRIETWRELLVTLADIVARRLGI